MVDKSLGAGYTTKKYIKELYIICTYHYKEYKQYNTIWDIQSTLLIHNLLSFWESHAEGKMCVSKYSVWFMNGIKLEHIRAGNILKM